MTRNVTTSFKKSYSPGDIIFEQGDLCTCAYIIEKGKVEVSIERQGERHVLTTHGKGDLFGEMALIDETTRAATVTALEPTDVVIIERTIFNLAIEDINPIVSLLLHTIMDHRRRTNPSSLSKAELDRFYSSKRKHDVTYQKAHDQTISIIKSEAELEHAINNSQFELLFQPVVSLAENKIVGLESLIRWNHPEKGLIYPDEFIPTAENTGLINTLGRHIIELACDNIVLIENELPELFEKNSDFFVSINLSAKQFISPDFIDSITASFNSLKVPPVHIMFEIKETLLMNNPVSAQQILNKLKTLGFRIAIDDFGNGYSCLSYLHSFPIETLKIDRDFIASMHSNETSMTIIKAILGLSAAIGMNAIAVGVENEEQLGVLTKLGCNLVQGYYLYEPMHLNEIGKILNV